MRGYVESAIDDMIQKVEIVSGIEWVQGEIPISSLRDLALGYVIAMWETFIVSTILLRTEKKCSNEDMTIIRGIVRRRLPEIVEKIEKELHR